MRRAGVRNAVVIGAVVLVGLLAGEVGATPTGGPAAIRPGSEPGITRCGEGCAGPGNGGMFPVRLALGLERQAGEHFRDCPTCPEMVAVLAGSYEMGSPASEVGRFENEGPVHRVTIVQPLAVGVYEVTREEFWRFVEATGYSFAEVTGYWIDREKNAAKKLVDEGILGENAFKKLFKMLGNCNWRDPSYFLGDRMPGKREPVVCVSWEDAQAYVWWLSQETGQAYRLLSETEWEYVTRAGTGTARYWGQLASDQCQYENGADILRTQNSIKMYKKSMNEELQKANSDADREILRELFERMIEKERTQEKSVLCNDGYVDTSPVGTYKANAFGLHDVLGNVSEWVEDCRHSHYSDPFLMDYYSTFKSEDELKKFDSYDEFARSAKDLIARDPSLRSRMKSDMDRARAFQIMPLGAGLREDRAPVDSSAWLSGDCSVRMVRGGSFLSDPRNVRAAYRDSKDAGFRSHFLGFRVARTLAGSAAMPQAAR